METIRYYEREGLLPAPARSAANYRLYDARHQERLQFIRHCRSLDIGLSEIRQLLLLRSQPQQSCLSVNALLDAKLAQVEQRLAELTRLQQELQQLRGRCSAPASTEECGILRSLSSSPECRS